MGETVGILSTGTEGLLISLARMDLICSDSGLNYFSFLGIILVDYDGFIWAFAIGLAVN